MDTKEEMTLSEKLTLLAKETRSHKPKVHWSHRSYVSFALAALGVVLGYLIWYFIVSSPFYEWRKAQDGPDAAVAGNVIMMLSIMVLLMSIAWFIARRLYNKHTISTPDNSEEES